LVGLYMTEEVVDFNTVKVGVSRMAASEDLVPVSKTMRPKTGYQLNMQQHRPNDIRYT